MLEEAQVQMQPFAAYEHYLAYRRLTAKRRSREDQEVMDSYRELAKGHAILNADAALEAAGVDPETERPRLAFARADWPHVFCEIGWGSSLTFRANRWGQARGDSKLSAALRATKPLGCSSRGGTLTTTVVPIIPAAHRPESKLDRYWIAWEVEKWEQVPHDPLLLKRLNARTFAVLAAWDLTEVERMVLAGRGPAQ